MSSSLQTPRAAVSRDNSTRHLPLKAASLLTLGVIGLTATLAVKLVNRPAPMSENAPLGTFSAHRALEHVAQLSRSPRPSGSVAHAAARDYIVQVLREQGLSPKVQRATAVNDRYRNAGSVENIVARMRGKRSDRPLLMVAHYDSVSTGPGAGDNAGAVGALLEASRTVNAVGSPQRDIILLFTDLEESGLLGAGAFVKRSRLREAGPVFNFDARGTGGLVYMFETGRPSDALLAALTHMPGGVSANSVAALIYDRMPNDTDFSVFKKAGYTGMNFAFIKGLSAYHTMLDSRDALDPITVQQQGEIMLGLMQHDESAVVTAQADTNLVYFDVLGRWMVRYGWPIASLITAVALLLVAAVLFSNLKTGVVTSREVFKGFWMALLALLMAPLPVMACMAAMRWLTAGPFQEQSHLIYRSGLVVAGEVLLALSLSLAAALWELRRAHQAAFEWGAMLIWCCGLLALTFLLPGASYLLAWPLLALASSWAWRALRPGIAADCCVMAAVIPTTFIWVPFLVAVECGLDLDSAIPLSILAGALLVLFASQLHLERSKPWWISPVVLALCGAGLLTMALAGNQFTAKEPRQDSLMYMADSDSHRQVLATYDTTLDDWTRASMGGIAKRRDVREFFPWISAPLLQTPVQIGPLPPPGVTIRADSVAGAVRTVDITVKKNRDESIFSFYVPHSTALSRVLVNGEDATGSRTSAGDWQLRYYNVPEDGVNLHIETTDAQPIRMQVQGISRGLPGGLNLRLRPEAHIPAPLFLNDTATVVHWLNL